MENKNTIIALVLMFAVWVGFTILFPPASTVPPSTQEEAVKKEAPPIADLDIKKPEVVSDIKKELIPPVPAFADVKERDILVENKFYKAVFTNSGARLKKLELKNFRVEADPESDFISLIDVEKKQEASLRSVGFGDFEISPETLYKVSIEKDVLQLSEGQTSEIAFKTVTPDGLVVDKIYTFSGDKYEFESKIRISNTRNEVMQGRFDFSLLKSWDESKDDNKFGFSGPMTFIDEEVKTDKIDDVAEKAPVYGNKAVWSGFETKYFMSAVVPLQSTLAELEIKKVGNIVENIFKTPETRLSPGESVTFEYLVYFGPRDMDILKQVGHNLERAIDFGFFSLLSRPLLEVIKFFYSFVGNYGVAIILLTIIIKIIFWPLTHKSYASMKAMQKLQPEMQRIRERFKNDRERLNREIMEMYRKNRVNPLGGCLPMLVQIPVFIALYKVLLDYIALRHAPFAFWITDLSAKDPYYITPLVMGATMFIQQKMTPSTMDPTQAKMFMLMPVIFTFLFLNFPAGLVIYWLVNNLLTIVQQYFINRKA